MPEPTDPEASKKAGSSSWKVSEVETSFRAPRPGTLLNGRYLVQEKIDPETFLATDTGANRPVIIRSTVWRNRNLAAVWRREIRKLTEVQSPRFLNIHEVVTEGEIDFVISERPPEIALKDLLRDRASLELGEALPILGAVAEGLDLAASFVRFWSSLNLNGIYLEAPGATLEEIRARPIAEWPLADTKLDLWRLLRPNHVPPTPTAGSAVENKSAQAVKQIALLTYEFLSGRRRTESDRRRRYRPVPNLNDPANSILYSGVQGWPIFESASSFLKDLELAAQSMGPGLTSSPTETGSEMLVSGARSSSRRPLVLWILGVIALVAAIVMGSLFFHPAQRKPATAVAAATATPKRPASISLRSEPAGATVRLDGTESGKTPLVGINVGPGAHLLTIELAGYQTREVPVDLAAGQTEDLGTVVLLKPAGELSLNTDPSGIPFELVGPNQKRYAGVTPSTLQQLEPGSYTIHFRPAGFTEYTENFEVNVGQPVRLAHNFSTIESERNRADAMAAANPTPNPESASPSPSPAEESATATPAARPKVLAREKPRPTRKKPLVSREVAFRKFNAEWDAKEKYYEDRIGSIDQKIDTAGGVQKKQLIAYKKYLQHRKNAVKDLRKYKELALKREYNEPESSSVLDGIKNIFGL
jgi:PEGA domain